MKDNNYNNNQIGENSVKPKFKRRKKRFFSPDAMNTIFLVVFSLLSMYLLPQTKIMKKKTFVAKINNKVLRPTQKFTKKTLNKVSFLKKVRRGLKRNKII